MKKVHIKCFVKKNIFKFEYIFDFGLIISIFFRFFREFISNKNCFLVIHLNLKSFSNSSIYFFDSFICMEFIFESKKIFSKTIINNCSLA